MYVKKNMSIVLNAGATSLEDYNNVSVVEDKWVNYTRIRGGMAKLQVNSLVKFKVIGGEWYAIEGLFDSIIE